MGISDDVARVSVNFCKIPGGDVIVSEPRAAEVMSRAM